MSGSSCPSSAGYRYQDLGTANLSAREWKLAGSSAELDLSISLLGRCTADDRHAGVCYRINRVQKGAPKVWIGRTSDLRSSKLCKPTVSLPASTVSLLKASCGMGACPSFRVAGFLSLVSQGDFCFPFTLNQAHFLFPMFLLSVLPTPPGFLLLSPSNTVDLDSYKVCLDPCEATASHSESATVMPNP